MIDFLPLSVSLVMKSSLFFSLKFPDMLLCEALEFAWDLSVHEAIADWQAACSNDEWDLYSADSSNSVDSDLMFVILAVLTRH